MKHQNINITILLLHLQLEITLHSSWSLNVSLVLYFMLTLLIFKFLILWHNLLNFSPCYYYWPPYRFLLLFLYFLFYVTLRRFKSSSRQLELEAWFVSLAAAWPGEKRPKPAVQLVVETERLRGRLDQRDHVWHQVRRSLHWDICALRDQNPGQEWVGIRTRV